MSSKKELKIKCLSWNVRSINNKVNDVLNFAFTHNVSLLFVQETWLTDMNNHTTALIKSHGFKIHHYHRRDQSGGGVAIIYRPAISLIRVFTTVFQTFECVCVRILLPDRKSLLCVCVYRTGPMGTFISDFDEFIGELFPRYDKFLICGDVNIHLEKVSAHSTDFLRCLSSYGLVQHLHEGTHKAGHTLDMVVTSHKIIATDSIQILPETLQIFNSCDHYPIIFELQSRALSVDNKKVIEFRNLKKMDHENFAVDVLEAFDTKDGEEFASFENRLEHYNSSCQEILEKHAPLLQKVIKDIPSAPWFDSEYKMARIERRKAEKLWKKRHLEIDRDIFEHLRLHCEELADKKKKRFYREHFEKYNHSQKGLYKFVDIFLDNEDSLTLPPRESLQDTVEEFNKFFSDKIDAIRQSFPDGRDRLTPLLDSSFSRHKLTEFQMTNEEELREILKSTTIKSCASDPVPASLMKENLDVFLPEICHLVNLSLSTGNMDGVKSALLVPLLKNASLDSSSLKSYRPVSNLAFIGKVIEKVVQKRLEEHMKKNNLEIPLQSAYKKHHSTETLLIRIVNDLLIATDEKKATVVMLLDLSAAFDTVDHDKLLNILQREIGVCGVALEWFSSYLKGRCQRVKIGTFESADIIIKFGVPQGSVLGPILFNIYIRSLYSTVKSVNFNIHGFADDHQVYKAFNSNMEYQIMTNDLPSCFAEIDRWMIEHFLQLNPGKTEIIVFGSQPMLSKLQLNGVFISPSICIRLVPYAKNLGFYLDSSLSFNTQIKRLKSSCYHKLRNLAKMKPFLNVKQMQQLVQALILSSLDYCNALYYGTSSNTIRQLQSIQNRACATILGLKKREPTTEHLKNLHWLKVQERIEFKILLVTYKALNGQAPMYISEIINYNPLSGSRSPSLQTYVSKTSFGDRAFMCCAAKLWNALPEDIRLSVDVDIFKIKLKTYLFKKSYNTDT